MERQLAELCSGLLDLGYRVTVVARRCDLAPHPQLRWIRIRSPRRPFSVKYSAFLVMGSLALLRCRAGLVHTTGALVLNRADVSTVHFCHHGFRAAGGPLRMSRSQLAYRLNALVGAWMSRAAERFCYRPARTRHLVAVSGGVARELKAFFPVKSAGVTVIPNGVDRATFAPDPGSRAEIRARLSLAGDDLVAIFVGGDWKRKGLRFAVEGVARTPDWHLLVIGRGDEATYRQIAAENGAADRIHFLGSMPLTAPYFSSADAFVLPTSYEAFPLVSLEAAAAGLPLLIGRVSGVEELLDDGENGWFVEREGGAIAERLQTLGGDPELRGKMAAAAREASGRYEWGQVVDSYASLYATLAR